VVIKQWNVKQISGRVCKSTADNIFIIKPIIDKYLITK
jgi:hypothetical protein